MKSFDIVFLLLAIGGTIGMMGLGVALAQLSFTIFIISAGVMAGCIVYGFIRKNRLAVASENSN